MENTIDDCRFVEQQNRQPAQLVTQEDPQPCDQASFYYTASASQPAGEA